MRFKLISVLAILALLLALVFLVPAHNEITSTLKEQRISSIFDRNSISRIRLTGLLGSYDFNKSLSLNDKNPMLLRSEWVLREPLYAPVKNEKIQELVNLVFNISGEMVPEGEFQKDRLEEYGLLPPAIVLILDFEGKKEVFSLGSVNQVTERFFIMKEGEETFYLTHGSIIKKIQEILADIRSEQVLKFDSSKIKQLDVLRGDSFYRLFTTCSEVGNNWSITSDGIEMRADSDLVTRELKELTEIRVSKIYDNPLDILQFTGLANPILIFKVLFKGDSDAAACSINENAKDIELIFQIGKGVSAKSELGKAKLQGSLYLKINGENVIYEIDKGTFGDWLQSVDHFRDKTPFSEFDAHKFSKVELLFPEKKCANLVELAKVKDAPLIVEKFKNLRFDMFVQKDEFKNYTMITGTKIAFKSESSCYLGYEEIGNLEQSLEPSLDKKEVVAKFVRLFKCGEPEIYGILSREQAEEISSFALKACTN